ncbi:hypothetical protein OCU04_002780 [Sclerotinia nivalis]|uniref:Protein kinase domain-containing protein n=1 Tax=Sclerotinia nivalis TaxID=352851 RepID=A0A9X0DQJ1_9HELO|nr:hypothetical protein OCU04_002780 [Sclerotinia nivalis]
MAEPCIPLFQQLAQAPTTFKPLSLQEYFWPAAKFSLRRLADVNGKPKIELMTFDTKIEAQFTPSISFPSNTYPDIKRIASSQVIIVPNPLLMEFALAHGPSKVLVENLGEYYFKEALDRESLESEIGILFKLKNTVLGKENRIPQLYAVVQDTSDGPILGFLTHFIKGETLPDVMKKLPSASLKHKWISQLQKTVDEIHQEGIVWGDAKPDNILVDQDDNLVVLDFNGGRTEGWVAAEYMDTMIGDNLATAKIKDMILENSS